MSDGALLGAAAAELLPAELPEVVEVSDPLPLEQADRESAIAAKPAKTATDLFLFMKFPL